MEKRDFDKLVDRQLHVCKDILTAKGGEYAPSADRLAHFKHSASLMRTTPQMALFAFMAKHLISLEEMCESNDDFTAERWEEKITDSINYLILLKAIVMEDKYEKDTD